MDDHRRDSSYSKGGERAHNRLKLALQRSLQMRFPYTVKKALYSFWHKYTIRTQINNIAKLLLLVIIIWIFGSALTILSQRISKPEIHNDITDYLQYFWVVIIELISGYDVGEISLSLASRIIAVLMLILGLVLVGLFTGTLISMFVKVYERMEYLPEKPSNLQFRHPVLLCGLNSKIDAIIRYLRNADAMRDREIVIIDEDAGRYQIRDKKLYRDVWCVPENPTFRDVLKRSMGTDECHAIIMAKELKGPFKAIHADAKTVETALAIEALDDRVHTIVEILDPKNKIHLGRTRINEWVCIGEYGVRLISQCALQPGIADVFMKLLGGDGAEKNGVTAGDSIHLSGFFLPEIFRNTEYRKAANTIRARSDLDITPIGFARYLSDEEKQVLGMTLRNTNYFMVMNPRSAMRVAADSDDHISGLTHLHRDTLLGQHDKIIYISDNEVDLDKHFPPK